MAKEFDPPVMGFEDGEPSFWIPWQRGYSVEKLIIEAAFEAKQLSRETDFNIAMGRIETAIRCAGHLLDHGENGK